MIIRKRDFTVLFLDFACLLVANYIILSQEKEFSLFISRCIFIWSWLDVVVISCVHLWPWVEINVTLSWSIVKSKAVFLWMWRQEARMNSLKNSQNLIISTIIYFHLLTLFLGNMQKDTHVSLWIIYKIEKIETKISKMHFKSLFLSNKN